MSREYPFLNTQTPPANAKLNLINLLKLQSYSFSEEKRIIFWQTQYLLTFETLSQWTTTTGHNISWRNAWLQSICTNLPFLLTPNLIGLNVWPLTVLSYYFPLNCFVSFPLHSVWRVFTVFLFSAQDEGKPKASHLWHASDRFHCGLFFNDTETRATGEFQFFNMHNVSWWRDGV